MSRGVNEGAIRECTGETVWRSYALRDLGVYRDYIFTAGFSSDISISWNIAGYIGYELPWYRITPVIGYRALYDKYKDESGDNRFVWDVDIRSADRRSIPVLIILSVERNLFRRVSYDCAPAPGEDGSSCFQSYYRRRTSFEGRRFSRPANFRVGTVLNNFP